MSIPEVAFKIDDRVSVPGGAIGEVMAFFPDRGEAGEALVRFPDGRRALFSLGKLSAAPGGAHGVAERYSAS